MEEPLFCAKEKTSYGSLHGAYMLLKGFHKQIPLDVSSDVSLSILNVLKDCKEEIMDIESTLLHAYTNYKLGLVLDRPWRRTQAPFEQANQKLKQAICDVQEACGSQEEEGNGA